MDVENLQHYKIHKVMITGYLITPAGDPPPELWAGEGVLEALDNQGSWEVESAELDQALVENRNGVPFFRLEDSDGMVKILGPIMEGAVPTVAGIPKASFSKSFTKKGA